MNLLQNPYMCDPAMLYVYVALFMTCLTFIILVVAKVRLSVIVLVLNLAVIAVCAFICAKLCNISERTVWLLVICFIIVEFFALLALLTPMGMRRYINQYRLLEHDLAQ